MNDKADLKHINEIGAKIAELFEGHTETVVINVAASIYAGVAKHSLSSREEAHRVLDQFLDCPEGLTAEVVRVQ